VDSAFEAISERGIGVDTGPGFDAGEENCSALAKAPLKHQQNAINKPMRIFRHGEGSLQFFRFDGPSNCDHASPGSGRITGGEKIAVNLPLPFLVSKNEKLIVGFLDRCLVL
jgi:hypothetical protein